MNRKYNNKMIPHNLILQSWYNTTFAYIRVGNIETVCFLKFNDFEKTCYESNLFNVTN